MIVCCGHGLIVNSLCRQSGCYNSPHWFGKILAAVYSHADLVLFPDPNPRAGKGLVTLERFLGCTGT